jgi:DNA-binding NtrC family response regulator
VALNCAALPETLVESEIFGHEKGAFTGADASRAGVLERGAGGVVFLDEVGELTLSAQAKLLRAIETGLHVRVGGSKEIAPNVRIVAATNRDLEAEIEAGRFRRDLFFRLSAATVLVPPLRDRPQDLPLLARQFLDDACKKAGRPPLELRGAPLERVYRYRWPGNVRELKNAMEFAAATCAGPVLEVESLPQKLNAAPAAAQPSATAPPLAAGEFRDINDEIRELEKSRMQAALDTAGGNQTRAAELINMALRTFVTKMKLYGVAAPRR